MRTEKPFPFIRLLALLIAISFPAVLLGARTFYFRDFGYFGYPFAFYYRQSFWTGELPLWNPYNSAGIPFMAQWNTLVLYPPSLLYLLLPLPWSLNLFCLLHLLLAGAGMQRLARAFDIDRTGAALAGTAFAFSAFTVSSLLWPHTIAALGWMPWAIYFSLNALEGQRASIPRASLAGAMQMLTGAPEIILMTWLLLLFFWLAGFAGTLSLRALGRIALVVLLVTGMSAAQLLPFFQLLWLSHREPGFAESVWAMPPWGWLNLIAPLFRTYQTPQGIFFQFEQDWLASYYPGIAVLALASVAVLRPAPPRWRALGVLTLVSLWLAMGDAGGLYTWLKKVFPFLAIMRYPVKFVAVATFALPLLAGYGLHSFKAAHWPATRIPSRNMALALGILFSLLLLVALSITYTRPKYQETIAATGLLNLTRLLFLWAAVWGIFYLTRPSAAPASGGTSEPTAQPPLIPPLAGARARELIVASAAALLVWLDLLTYAPNQSPTASPGIFEPGLQRIRPLQPMPEPGASRALVTRAAYESFYKKSLANPQVDYLCHRLGLFSNCNLLDAIPVTDGFYALHLDAYRKIWSLYFNSPSLENLEGLLDFLSVSQTSSRTNELSFDSRITFAPWATIGAEPVFAGPEQTMNALWRGGFDGRSAVYLPPEARGVIRGGRNNLAKVVSSRWAPHRIELLLECDAPALLVLNQAWYPAWKAFLDGEPVRLWRANVAFQAADIPAGSHKVELRYRDKLFYVGAAVSLITLIGLGISRVRPWSVERGA